MIRAGANVWVISTGDRRVLVDTGSGVFLKERFPDTGQLGDTFGVNDIRHEDITDIVLTHMHADHIGGLIHTDRSLFQRAKIHVAEAEWAFWTAPALARAVPDDMKPLVALLQTVADLVKDQVVPHQGETDLGDGLSLVPAPGHTLGHSTVRVEDGGARFMILATRSFQGCSSLNIPTSPMRWTPIRPKLRPRAGRCCQSLHLGDRFWGHAFALPGIRHCHGVQR